MGEGGRLRALEARGERPWCLKVGRTLRSIGERGEAGDASRERPTGPIGEHGTRFLLPGEGGKIAAFLRSRGVTGDRSREVRWRGEIGLVRGDDFSARGEGKGTARGEGRGEFE